MTTPTIYTSSFVDMIDLLTCAKVKDIRKFYDKYSLWNNHGFNDIENFVETYEEDACKEMKSVISILKKLPEGTDLRINTID